MIGYHAIETILLIRLDSLEQSLLESGCVNRLVSIA